MNTTESVSIQSYEFEAQSLDLDVFSSIKKEKHEWRDSSSQKIYLF